MSRKLTTRQKEVFQLLNKTPNGIIRQHVKGTGTICWRVLDEKMNPLLNVSETVVRSLKEKNLIELKGHNYELKATVEA